MNQANKDILNKFLAGNSTDEQFLEAHHIFNTGDAEGLKNFVRKDWDEYLHSQEIPNRPMGALLDRIHHQIGLNENAHRIGRFSKLMRQYAAIAAVLFLPVLAFSIFVLLNQSGWYSMFGEQSSFVKIEAPVGTRMAFQLPDGTLGMLNAGSAIEYQMPFRKQRHVKVTGEAYFDVTHDKKHPFIVKTYAHEIEVVGTKFNVYAYPNEPVSEVILEEGKIICTLNNLQRKITLKPNERIVYNGDKVEKSKLHAASYTAWKDGKLVFRGDTMEELAKRLSRWYNVEVEIADKSLNAYTFRATFHNDSLEEVLALLKMTSPISYRIEPRKRLDDGSFTSKKIIFFKKQK